MTYRIIITKIQELVFFLWRVEIDLFYRRRAPKQIPIEREAVLVLEDYAVSFGFWPKGLSPEERQLFLLKKSLKMDARIRSPFTFRRRLC